MEKVGRHGNVALNLQTILIQNVKQKREHVRIKLVLAGQNGRFGVLVQQIAGHQEKAHRHKKDIDAGTPKQVLELIVVLGKETTITINLSHVIVTPISIVNLIANGKSGVNGVIVIQTVMKVSS